MGLWGSLRKPAVENGSICGTTCLQVCQIIY